LSILLGVAVFVWPQATLAVVAELFGLWLLISGIIRLVMAFARTGAGTARNPVRHRM
jgi:uncharacterized membrane protein HdeD (DUF308 family)